jgi:hypothetical protein
MTGKDLEFFNERFDRIEAMLVAVHYKVERLERKYMYRYPEIKQDETEYELRIVRLYREVEGIEDIFRQMQERT